MLFQKDNPEITMKDLEKEFEHAEYIKNGYWISPSYTISVNAGGGTVILKNEDILWIYYIRRYDSSIHSTLCAWNAMAKKKKIVSRKKA